MQELDIQLMNLQKKIQLLLKQHQILIKENSRLKNENAELIGSLAQKDNLLQNLRQHIDLLNLKKDVLGEEDKKILEKRIDEYLHDVEKCLSLLNV